MIVMLVGVALIAGGAVALYFRRSERANERAAVATETITCGEAAALARGSYDTALAPTVAAGKVTVLRSDGTAWQAQRGSAAVTSAALDGDRLVVAQT